MTTSTRLTNYFGNRSNINFNYAANRVQGYFERFRTTIRSIGTAFQAAAYGLRQEVPFERWFFDHGFQKPLDNCTDEMKARAWAILATLEGAVRCTAEVTTLLYSQIFQPQETERHLDVLQAQSQGLQLSLLAILSPNLAKEKAHNSEGDPIIGASLANWRWGTLYSGKYDAPFWHLECTHYPWFDRPAHNNTP
jgi:hypothetical protein